MRASKEDKSFILFGIAIQLAVILATATNGPIMSSYDILLYISATLIAFLLCVMGAVSIRRGCK